MNYLSQVAIIIADLCLGISGQAAGAVRLPV